MSGKTKISLRNVSRTFVGPQGERIEALRASVPFVNADAAVGFYVQMQFYRIGTPPFFLPGDAWPIFGPFTERMLLIYQDRYPDCQAK